MSLEAWGDESPEVWWNEEQIAEAESTIEALREALMLAQRMCTEALPQFNWGASCLDANAVDLLNRAPIAIAQALTPNATCDHTFEDRLARACMAVGIPDSKYESLLIALNT